MTYVVFGREHIEGFGYDELPLCACHDLRSVEAFVARVCGSADARWERQERGHVASETERYIVTVGNEEFVVSGFTPFAAAA